MPHLMNCQHSGTGWCLECVGKLAALNEQARHVLEMIEQVGHNPADLASDLNGLPDRDWQLALRLAGMASDAFRLPATYTHDYPASDLQETLRRLRARDGILSDCTIITSDNCQALIAEVERLRAIAAPLERLEAWRGDEDHIFELWEVVDDDGNAMIRVELSDSNRDRCAAGVGALLATAITAALDSWEQQHGKAVAR